MAEPLTLTFAEIEFLLRARPEQAVAVRRSLRIAAAASSDIVVAAGMASLLARGLCEQQGADVRPTDRLSVVTAALSTTAIRAEVAGWTADPPVMMHVYDGPWTRLAIVPAAFGQFSFEPLHRAEPLAAPILRFLDTCSAGDTPVAIAVQSTHQSGSQVSIAVARDADGTWHISDSLDNPDYSHPTTREDIGRRVSELFASQRVTVG